MHILPPAHSQFQTDNKMKVYLDAATNTESDKCTSMSSSRQQDTDLTIESAFLPLLNLSENERMVEYEKLTPEEKLKIKHIMNPEGSSEESQEDEAIVRLKSLINKFSKNLDGENYLKRKTRFLNDHSYENLTFTEFDEKFISLYIGSIQRGFGSRDLTSMDKYSTSFLLMNMVVGEARIFWKSIDEPLEIIEALLNFTIANSGQLQKYEDLKVSREKTNYHWLEVIKNDGQFKLTYRSEVVSRLMHTSFVISEKSGKCTGIPYQRFGFTLHALLDGFTTNLNKKYHFQTDPNYILWNGILKRKSRTKISVAPTMISNFEAGAVEIDQEWERTVHYIRENWDHFVNLENDKLIFSTSEMKKYSQNKKEAERRYNLGFRVSNEDIKEHLSNQTEN